jgi:hypothetical protein
MDVFGDLHTRCFVFVWSNSERFAADNAHSDRTGKLPV